MEFDELQEQYGKLKDNFNMLKNILKPNDDGRIKAHLGKIEKIINETLPKGLQESAPPNFPEIYFDFKYEYEKFREFILYDKLIGKNIVALGGGFSSGKSSFLNSLLKKPILPSEIDPSTSVPTYIVSEKDENIYGINVFNTKLEMKLKDIRAIAHGFGEITTEEDTVEIDEVKLGHVLKSIFVATPLQTYEHVAFLDTPGYSKPDTVTYSAKTDEKIARAQLNSSNFILWFIQADDGIISEEDIKFLNTIKKEIPKLIIVNKADTITPDEVENVKKKVKDVLDAKGIMYVSVLAYSRRKPNEYDSQEIRMYLDIWNKEVSETTFARNFKVLFVKCREYYEELTMNESKRLNRLNTAITLSDNSTVTECLNSLISEIKRNIAKLKDSEKKLKTMQDEFFTEIKAISNIVGIEMPEPSEIDLIQDKIQNPLEVLRRYKEKNGIKTNNNLAITMMNILADVKPVIQKQQGGSEFKIELAEIIKSNLNLDPKKIKFNDVYDTDKELKKTITKTLGR